MTLLETIAIIIAWCALITFLLFCMVACLWLMLNLFQDLIELMKERRKYNHHS
jgi:hypothetical protein